ncbi:hypothetical protein MASR1M50_03940 [Burkholderiales bacterium]
MNNGTSRLGVRGVEDLGGGLKAGFNFETGLSLEDGTTSTAGAGFWGRNANMWLGGSWGTFQMGRTLNPSFYGVAAWELTGTANYSVVGNTYGYVGGARNSSEFSYKTPDFGGLTAKLGYIMKADNGGNAKWDLNVVYANGPIAAGLSANKAKGQKVGYALGGKYNFGNFAVAASYSDNHKVRRGFSIGGTANFGAASVTLDLTRDTKNLAGKKYTNGLLEGKYALSKRTFMYAAYLRPRRQQQLRPGRSPQLLILMLPSGAASDPNRKAAFGRLFVARAMRSAVATWCGVRRLMEQIKPMDFWSGQGANRSDTRRYREDVQRRPGRKDAVLCSG